MKGESFSVSSTVNFGDQIHVSRILKMLGLVLVALAYNPNTTEAKATGSPRAPGQPELQYDHVSNNKIKQKPHIILNCHNSRSPPENI